MDTNILTSATQAAAKVDPTQIAAQITAYGTAIVMLAMILGRAWHAFQTGAGMISGVLQGTNTSTAVTGNVQTVADYAQATRGALLTGDHAAIVAPPPPVAPAPLAPPPPPAPIVPAAPPSSAPAPLAK